ncbi:MAG: hypothetical protein C0597_00345 [Marinilabiliales bacterium]|nr:MAG: hypothetical protein C0597_00345 [Marinilabiliales bacterium]
MKKILFLIAGMFWFFYTNADIPTGYYSTTDGLTEEALRAALHNIIDDHIVKTYGDARYILDDSDKDPNNNSNLILIYTGTSVSSNWDAGATWNREHIWSKSHGFPDEGTDIPYSDLHNLKPSYPSVNTDRSDKDFDEGGEQHDVATECFFTSTTWEPRDDVKGDVARIMLYMVVRYEGDATGEPDLELVDEITSYPDPEFGVFSTLLKWHYEDPVDDFERNRNNVIYSYQENRNPFIDHPEFVSLIWGGGNSNPSPTISDAITIPSIPNDSEVVDVSATITDDGEIESAEIHWGLISGALLDTIPMNNTSGNVYTTSTSISSQTDGTIVYYEIYATDDSSGITVSEEYNYTVDNNPPDIILDEKFTSCPLSGWTNYSVSGSENWECSDYGYLEINAYGATGASDDWFISPSINMELYSDEYLTFKSWTKYTDTSYPTIELKYSIDYSGSGDPTVATWSDLSATWSAEDSQEWTNSGEIDLSSISGTNFYIAFRYTSSGTASGQCAIWEIDDIYMSEKSNLLPIINQISHTPENPTESQDITIQANITDADGTISSANIKWGTSSGSYPNTVPMSNTNDEYSGIIPSQTGGTFIYYIIEATDDDMEIKKSGENIVSINSNGNNIPQISNITINPEQPGSSDNVSVIATITDSDGTISIAQMIWGTTSGNYEFTMDMTNTGDEFSGFIPSRDEDTQIYFIIKAIDNNGGLVQSAENNYMVNNPPVITNVSFAPENPTKDDNVVVSADISDENGAIATAILKWKKINGSYSDLTMVASGNIYEATIPKQESGDSIIFMITATDSNGKDASYSSGYIVESADGISDVTENNLLVYPNPASEKINISIQNYSGELDVQICNLEGKVVYSEKLMGNKTNEISINKMKRGMYILKVIYGTSYSTQKLLLK